MATTRKATTRWEGTLLDGKGSVELESSGVGRFGVNWPSRAEEPSGRTSPEELIAAAHSSCFSMALSHGLTNAGFPPQVLQSSAEVGFQPGTGITGVKLRVRGTVPGITADQFLAAAEDAKTNCPVSQALAGVEITLAAELA